MEKASFSSRVKELREKYNLTQTEFAARIGATQATLSSYENTNKTPSLEIVKKIAETFTVSVDWLLGLSDIMDTGDKPRRYSDVIRLLFKLEEANLNSFYFYSYTDQVTGITQGSISFGDFNIITFLSEWSKMRELHNNNTIDDELYDLWIEKTLRKYDKPIQQPTSFMCLPDGIDDELPFN